MQTIWVLVLDGLLDSSLAITLDVLRTASAVAQRSGASADFEVRLLGATAKVRTGCGLTVQTDRRFRAAFKGNGDSGGDARPSLVVVPALGVFGKRLDARLQQADARQAVLLLQRLHQQGVRIGASCASVFLLAEAGLLAQRKATTTWWLAEPFRARYPQVLLDERRMVVADGSLVTAGSAFSQMDLMLALLRDLVGLQVADLCARYLLIDSRPSQARYMARSHAMTHDPAAAAAEAWIDAHLGEPFTVRALAEALAMSEKTLGRKVQAALGITPSKLIQRRRLMMAAHLIQTSKLPIEAVSAQVGYQDSTSLRRLFKRDYGSQPNALR